MKLVDDCIFEVYGKHITRTEGDIQLEGSNASAEEADEGTDAASVSGVDLVLNHRLVETGFGSKKDYTVYLKDYMKKVVKYLEENDRAGEVDDFKKNIAGKMKELLGKFKDLQFFTGESVQLCYCSRLLGIQIWEWIFRRTSGTSAGWRICGQWRPAVNTFFLLPDV